MNIPHPRVYAFWLALLRIFTGAFWLAHGIPKFTDSSSFMPPNGTMGQFMSKAVSGTTGSYHDFLVNTVMPNAWIFAELVRLGEVVAGCLLIFGLFTRLGGLIGVALGLNYLAAKGLIGSVDGWSGIDGLTVVLSGIAFLLPTGRFLGVDWILTRRPRATVQSRAYVAPPQPVVSTPSSQQGQPIHAEFVDEPPLGGGGGPVR